MKEVLIVDCDIVVENFHFTFTKDTLFKKGDINSGLYFIKDINTCLKYMTGDAIETGMIHPIIHPLKTIHLGTPEEYYNAIL